MSPSGDEGPKRTGVMQMLLMVCSACSQFFFKPSFAKWPPGLGPGVPASHLTSEVGMMLFSGGSAIAGGAWAQYCKGSDVWSLACLVRE